MFAEFGNPITVVTKNRLVARDRADLAADRAAAVCLSVTILNPELGGKLAPRASRPAGPPAAVAELPAARVPAGVTVDPVIPGLTDHELPAILWAAAQAGPQFAGYVLLRLPLGVGPLFGDCLARHYPERRTKVLARVRDVRGGKLNDAGFGSRMSEEAELAGQIRELYRLSCRRVGLSKHFPELLAAAFPRPARTQSLLFE